MSDKVQAGGWPWGLLLALLLGWATPGRANGPVSGPATWRRQLATAPDTARPRLLRLLADYYLYTNFDSAWSYARRAYDLARQQHSDQALYYSYGQLGILYGMRGNAEASLRTFLAQLHLNQRRPDSARYRPGILSNIANSYYGQSKYAAAASLLSQARQADAARHDTAGLLADLSNLNQVLLKQGRARQALQASQEAVRLVRYLPTPTQESCQAYLCLVNTLHELGCYAAARDTTLALLPRLQRAHQGQQLAYAYHLLLRDYLALRQLPAAEQAGQQALAYARPAGMLDVERDVQLTLGEVAARAGSFAQAYRHQRQADSLTARLTRESNAKTVEDMQFKYDTERQEAQVVTLRQRVRAGRWQAGLGTGLALVALAAAALLYRAKRLQATVFSQREQLQAQQATQQALAAAARRQQEEAQRQLEAAERHRLELELAASQREQASAALFAQQKTQLLADLTGRLDALARRVPEVHRLPVTELKKDIGQHLRVAADWDRAVLHFEKIHPEFFALLHQRCPALTPGELKQCAYLKLNLTNKDIASLLNIEPSSVKISHYRIKKKLELSESESLRDFILAIA